VPDDLDQISSIVLEVTREKYGHFFSNELMVSNDPNSWKGSWVVADNNVIVGVGLSNDDCIDDLWLRSQYRGRNIGSDLLSILESQIEKSGHLQAKLRVVAENEAARRFYRRQGWQELKTYPHEKWGFLMVDMQKALN
jgi:ribosomal protein S18 acetylase RimI-like enzyme